MLWTRGRGLLNFRVDATLGGARRYYPDLLFTTNVGELYKKCPVCGNDYLPHRAAALSTARLQCIEPSELPLLREKAYVNPLKHPVATNQRHRLPAAYAGTSRKIS